MINELKEKETILGKIIEFIIKTNNSSVSDKII